MEIKVISNKQRWGQLVSMHSGSLGGPINSFPQLFPADFKHIFSSNREPSRLLITNPLGYQVAGNFIKQNSPGSFNRGAQEAKTPLALWPHTRAQLQRSLPHSSSAAILLSSVSMTMYQRVTLESLERVVLLQEEASNDPWEECCTGCEPFYSSDRQLTLLA